MLDSANRNWRLLDAEFAQRLLLVFRIMRGSMMDLGHTELRVPGTVRK